MRQTLWGLIASTAVALAMVMATAVPAGAQDMPRSFGVGTNPQGSLFYAAGSATAKVLTDKMPVPVRVQPYSGTTIILPLISSGELELGVNNTNDSRLAYRGLDPFVPAPAIRLASVLFQLRVAIMVDANSDIDSVTDLKGKRVAGEYNAHLAVWYNATSIMASYGMDWDDVEMVPTANVVTGAQLLIEDKVDAALFALGAGKVKEANASIPGGIKFLPINDTPDGIKRMQEVMPGTYAINVPEGSTTGVREDIVAQGYDVFLNASKHLSDNAVYTLVKTMYDAEEEIQGAFPPLRSFSRDSMVKTNVTVPYHPGAIKAYEELGLWSGEMDALQKKLLSEGMK